MAVAKYLTEFIGTFLLVLTIGLVAASGNENRDVYGPIAIGLMLMVLVYMGAHISGAHYNPAVTVAIMLRGACKIKDVVPYWVAQIAGAIAAALVVSLIIPNAAAEGELASNFFGPAPGKIHTLGSPGPWLIEIIFTFTLVLVILNVATSSGTLGNSYYGAAIGMTIAAAAYAGGDISGGAFNPAVGIGPNLIKGTIGGDAAAMKNMVLHIVGPLIGAVLGAIVFKFQEAWVDSEAKHR